MSVAIFKVVTANTTLKCMNSGEFSFTSTQHTVKIDGADVIVAGDSASPSGAACTKAPPAFPAPCTSFAPAISLEAARVKVGGKQPVVEFSPQISVSNGIPAFTYTGLYTNVKVL